MMYSCRASWTESRPPLYAGEVERNESMAGGVEVYCEGRQLYGGSEGDCIE